MAAVDSGPAAGPTVAIFPWGEVIEEFLDSLGLDLDDFVTKMTGGWLFGYVLALQRQGWRPIIVCAPIGFELRRASSTPGPALRSGPCRRGAPRNCRAHPCIASSNG